MSQPPIKGDGLTLDDLKAAAERVLAHVGADGLPPASRWDAESLATFVRDLLSHNPSLLADSVVFGERIFVRASGRGIASGSARMLAAQLLRCAEHAESAALLRAAGTKEGQ